MSQITTHILDTAVGQPAIGVKLSLQILKSGDWQEIGHGLSNDDGRAPMLVPEQLVLTAGSYRLCFDTGAYFEARGLAAFYPSVDVVFTIDNSGGHYHIPLLLSPFGYSTYRGS